VTAQIIKFLVRQSSGLSCYFVPLKPKYLPQHPFLELPQPTFLPQSERPSFMSTKQHKKLQYCVFSSLYTPVVKRKTKDYAPNDSKYSLASICSYFLQEWNFDLLAYL